MRLLPLALLLGILLAGCADFAPRHLSSCYDAEAWHADEESRWATVNWTRSDWHRDQRHRFQHARETDATCDWWTKDVPWEVRTP